MTRVGRWRACRREKSIRLPVLSGQAVHGGVGGAGGGQLGGEGEGPARRRHASAGPRDHLSIYHLSHCNKIIIHPHNYNIIEGLFVEVYGTWILA